MSVAVSRRRFTADDYQRMGQAGILRKKDHVELIDGEIVTMTPIGPRHCANVDRAVRAFVTKAGDSAIVRVQGSVRLDLYSRASARSRAASPADGLLRFSSSRPRRHSAHRRSRRLVDRLRPGSQGACLCAIGCSRVLARRSQRAGTGLLHGRPRMARTRTFNATRGVSRWRPDCFRDA